MKKVGVIVGRFQVPELHAGHRYLIDTVESLHDQVLVVLGCTKIPSNRDPFSKEARTDLFRSAYPRIHITEIKDQFSDKKWSQKLDKIIMDLFPNDSAALYGSRKSFLTAYTGRFQAVCLPPIDAPSGTDVRKKFFMKKV